MNDNLYKIGDGHYVDGIMKELENGPIENIIADLNDRSLKVNIELMDSIIIDNRMKYGLLLKEIRDVTFTNFNPGKAEHVKSVLETLGVNTNSYRSFDQKTLNNIGNEINSSLPNKIAELRKIQRIISNGESIIKSAVIRGNYVNPFYQANSTLTGRMMGANPCLSNLATVFRKAIIAEKDEVFIYWDWKQFEVRIQASISGDEKLISLFDKGIDLHSWSIGILLDKPYEEVTSGERSTYKEISLGHWYGLGYEEISIRSGCSIEQAIKFKNKMNSIFSVLVSKRSEIIEKANRDLRIETIFGRIMEFASKPGYKAWAFLAQAMAADYFKWKLAELYVNLPQIKLCIPLFDGALMCVKESKVGSLTMKLKKLIGDNYIGFCKMDADVGIGFNWDFAERDSHDIIEEVNYAKGT